METFGAYEKQFQNTAFKATNNVAKYLHAVSNDIICDQENTSVVTCFLYPFVSAPTPLNYPKSLYQSMAFLTGPAVGISVSTGQLLLHSRRASYGSPRPPHIFSAGFLKIIYLFVCLFYCWRALASGSREPEVVYLNSSASEKAVLTLHLQTADVFRRIVRGRFQISEDVEW